ncbi:MAG: bifunctional oligoribonuclease/PAP phosphatase NrnA [Erysipelotrichaceae bacterium]|nr:bifunctional oligoribonuclease/PAP phosphatase NrnA [Erysipelotrichaceae bacterium]
MYKKLLDKIREYDCIAIFRHQKPDGDAMFSALAMNSFIKDNFKDKTVKVGGIEEYDIITRNDRLSDSFINKSLAIVLDTANKARIDDQRALNAPYMIKIDHHPPVENYGDMNIVDPETSAVCELMAKIFLSKDFKDCILSEKTIRYLYCGIVTDTVNFRTTNTTADTFSIASKLIKKGNLKAAELVEWVMDSDYRTFQKITKIRSNLIVNEKCGYIIMNHRQLNSLGMTYIEAKNKIDEIGTIKDLNVWAFATQNNAGSYDISVRSKRKYIVNKICARYGGGGHNNAAATKNLTRKQLENLINELIELSTK